MGICSSSESTSVQTAKLILQDGRLQEFPYPVKVSYILQTDPTCIICNSDELEFDDVITAVREDQELQVGQLYFALPRSKLRRPLRPDEMAALAVKASTALMKSAAAGDRCNSKALFSPEKEVFRSSKKVVDGGSVGGGEGTVGNGGDVRRRRRRRSGSNLDAILE
ncbi:hypothetical protein Dimus_017075 [Dionaea muscipula]